MTPERREKILRVWVARQTNLTVLLENVFDPHNISAVMRTCDAVGIGEIYVLNTRLPPHKKWGHRSSASARQWVGVHPFSRFEDCVEAIRKKYRQIWVSHPAQGSCTHWRLPATDSIALVFGNEQTGISEEMIAEADGSFNIPQVGMIESLNVSVACAITLYEVFRRRKEEGVYKPEKSRQELLAQALDEFEKKGMPGGRPW